MTRAKLTVLIPCFNSADVIEDCLRSVRWADEILVCDSFSTDATLDICRRYTDRIVQHEYVNSATQKNWAIPQVSHDWVLIVDTDERISDELRQEIDTALSIECPYNGFKIPRLNHAFGHPLRHGGFYPDYQLRLFRRDCARYNTRQVHAQVELTGECGVLTHPIVHFGQRTVDQTIRVFLLRYSEWEAEQRLSEGVRFHPSQMILRPIAIFLVRYVKNRGYRDGTAGLFMCLLFSAYVFLTYARIWQKQTHSQAPRVGFLLPSLLTGGAEVNLRTFLRAVDDQRLTPFILAPPQSRVATILADTGAAVISVPTPSFFSTSLRLGRNRTLFNPIAVGLDILLLLWASLGYARALRRAHIDVVHTGSVFAHLLGLIAAPLAGARLVWHVQDIISPRLGGSMVLPLFTRLGAWRVDRIVCISEAVASGLRTSWPQNIAQSKLSVVYNGVPAPATHLARAEARASLDLPNDHFVVCHVGRIVPWKGQREFLAAVRLLTAQHPLTTVLVVGDSTSDGQAYHKTLLSLVDEWHMMGVVRFLGWRNDIETILAASDVLAHTSILPEPFGLVITEAMAAERPVVVSSLGGPAEIVRHEESGFVVDPRDTAALAAALLTLAQASDLRQAMGRAGKATAERLFSAQRFARDLSAILRFETVEENDHGRE